VFRGQLTLYNTDPGTGAGMTDRNKKIPASFKLNRDLIF
jgi:hypothetical protein